ncbi:MAG: glucose-1-phosphate adenylyltransferase, partial [Oscillospiraceae bacterium]|nr:glucose-1-phosphate adenylyltransferase [Oscillospiraceae bacterium]
MLNAGEKLWPYRFKGYWRDVGTITSLWDANMDMLTPETLALYDRSWPISSRNDTVPPHYVGENAEIIYSIVTEGCEIDGRVENSVLSSSVTVEKGASVLYSVLMPGVTVKAGATVQYAIVGEDTVISENAVVGNPPDGTDSWGVATCGPEICIKEGARIPAGAMVYTGEEEFGND